jgi:rhamnogalacturonan endolyase
LQVRHIDDQVHGVTGAGVGAFMIIPGISYESSSGGPFFRGMRLQGFYVKRSS